MIDKKQDLTSDDGSYQSNRGQKEGKENSADNKP